MKLKYLFPIFIALFALMTSCEDEDTVTLLKTIQVSSSYVSIPVDGGSTSITVTANDSWTVTSDIEWLTISSTSGSAGESTLTFSAESTLDGRNAEILVQCGSETQRINIIQGLPIVSAATCKEIIEGPDSKNLPGNRCCYLNNQHKIRQLVFGGWNRFYLYLWYPWREGQKLRTF